MASTSRTTTFAGGRETFEALSWRKWPIVDGQPHSFLAIAVLAGIGIAVWWIGGGWALAALLVVALATTCWQFFVPVEYEVTAHGLRRRSFGRTRLVPWHAIRAYDMRRTGVVLYQRSAPGKIDLMRSMFVPYPANPDDLRTALRQHAAHANDVAE